MNISLPPLGATFTADGITYYIYALEPNIHPSEILSNQILHMHHYIEFFYVYSGQLSLMLSGTPNKIVLLPGSICMIPPKQYHEPASTGCERICFQLSFSGDEAGGDNLTLKQLRNAIEAKQLPIILNDTRIATMMELYRSSVTCAERTSILSAVAIHMLSKLTATSPSTATHNIISNRRMIIEEYISSSFGGESSLSKLARKMCLSERRTSDVVREIMGKSFKELVVEERMSVANLLLDDGRHTLDEISRIVGYSSYSSFYTAYKKFYGKAPSR